MSNLRGIVLFMTFFAPVVASSQDPAPPTPAPTASSTAATEAGVELSPAPAPTAASTAAAEAGVEASPQPVADAASTDMGTVIFFREKKFTGAAIRFKVRENGKELGKLSSGAYFTAQLPAGRHEFEVRSEAKDVLTMEIEPGETYYVIGSISMGVLAGHPNLSPSDQATFEKMKAELKDVTGQDIDNGESEK